MGRASRAPRFARRSAVGVAAACAAAVAFAGLASAQTVTAEPPPTGRLELPLPRDVEGRRVVEEQGESPEYYCTPEKDSSLPTFRLLPGVTASFPAAGSEWAFSFDAGAMLWLDAGQGRERWAFVVEAVYGFSMDAGYVHLGEVGVGPVGRTPDVMFGVVPRFAIGAAGGELALGMRTAATLRFAWDYLLGVELAHRWLVVDGRNLHALEFGVLLDVLGLLLLLDEEVSW